MNWGLFGALVVQVCKRLTFTRGLMSSCQNPDIYYLAFPNDRIGFKCLVYGLTLVETIQTVFMTHDAVMALGLGFGNPSALDDAHFSWLTIPLMSSIGPYFRRFMTITLICLFVVSAIVQCFFAWRIYILSKMWYVSVLIGVVRYSWFSCHSIFNASRSRSFNLLLV
jgi:hypothetical protein